LLIVTEADTTSAPSLAAAIIAATPRQTGCQQLFSRQQPFEINITPLPRHTFSFSSPLRYEAYHAPRERLAATPRCTPYVTIYCREPLATFIFTPMSHATLRYHTLSIT